MSHSPCKLGIASSIPDFSNHSGEAINRGLMTIYQDNLLIKTYFKMVEHCDVTNVLSPRDLALRPDLRIRNCAYIFNIKSVSNGQEMAQLNEIPSKKNRGGKN